MWFLKSDGDGKIFYIKANSPFTIGRRKGSLVLADNSVSRNHAEITVIPASNGSENKNGAEHRSTCTIKNVEARYGSVVIRDDGEEVPVTKEGIDLRHSNKILFGAQESIFTISFVSVISAVSGLNQNEKTELQKIMDVIDGKMTNGWERNCTHMTISRPTISEKFTCSLAYGTPVVPMEYWKCVLKAFHANEELPDPVDYADLIEQQMKLLGEVTVRPNPLRKTIFKGLTFVHFDSQQCKLHCRMIRCAGGKSLLFRDCPQDSLDVCRDDVIMVQLIESNTTQATGTGDANYAAVCKKLGKCHRRPIPSGEIALAIIHCSTSIYCNTRYDHANMFRGNVEPRAVESSKILAPDTLDVELFMPSSIDKPSTSGNKIIAESMERAATIESIPLESVEEVPLVVAGPCRSRDSHTSQVPTQNSVSYESQSVDSSMKVASFNYDRNREKEDAVMNIRNDKSSNKRCLTEDREESNSKKMCTEAFIKKKEAIAPDRSSNIFKKEKSKSKDDIFGLKEIRDTGGTVRSIASLFKTENRRKDTESEESHKRRASESDLSPTSKFMENPPKRSKTSSDTPKEAKSSNKSATIEDKNGGEFLKPKNVVAVKIETSTKWEVSKVESKDSEISMGIAKWDKENTGWIVRCKLEDSKYDEPKYDIQSIDRDIQLLRVTKSPSGEPTKYGKKFRKVYKKRPQRIELDQMVDMRSWIEDKKSITKIYKSSDEEEVIEQPKAVLPAKSRKPKKY